MLPAQHDHGNRSPREVLLAGKPGVGRDEDVEASRHGLEQLAVAQMRQFGKAGRHDIMRRKGVSKILWHTGIEENAHDLGSPRLRRELLAGQLDHGYRMLARDIRELRQKVLDAIPRLQIVEQGPHRNASACEHRRPAEVLGGHGDERIG